MVNGVEANLMQSSSPQNVMARSGADDHLLAEYARSGAPDVLARMVEQHSPMVYATCLRILGERSAAEDATQATFLALVRKARTLPPHTMLGPWLHHAARNAALELRRAEARRVRREKEAAHMANLSAPLAHDPHLIGEIDDALGALPAAQRDAVVLRYFYGFSAQEAAQKLRCPEETLHTRLTRAMQRLRERFGQRGTVTTAVALATFLSQQSAPIVPPGLAASITQVCAGKAVASATVLTTADALLKSMALAKVKAVAITVALMLAVATPAAYVGVRALQSSPAAPPAAASLKSSPVAAPATAAADVDPVPEKPAPAPVAAAKAALDEGPQLANFDFEDGHALPEWIGTLEAGPGAAREHNRFCLAGQYQPEFRYTKAQIGDNKKGIFTYRDGAVLSFDYWVEEKVFAVSVYMWDRNQNTSVGGFVDWQPVKNQWGHATVDLSRLADANGKHLEDGSLVIDATIQTGEGGGALYVDNIKVTVPRTRH
jgi:RNA polymerase sigma factor (sigma-70 family)